MERSENTASRGYRRPGAGPRRGQSPVLDWFDGPAGEYLTVDEAQGDNQGAKMSSGEGILDRDNPEKREQIVAMLTRAYWMEIETVMSYITNSTNPGRGACPGDHRVPQAGHPGGTRPRPAVRQPDQGTLRGGAGVDGIQTRAVVPAAARKPVRHRPRDQGCDQGRERRDRVLYEDHQGDRRRRSGNPGHGDRDPRGRAGTPPSLRRLSARVRSGRSA